MPHDTQQRIRHYTNTEQSRRNQARRVHRVARVEILCNVVQSSRRLSICSVHHTIAAEFHRIWKEAVVAE